MKNGKNEIILIFPRENVIAEEDVYHEKQTVKKENMNIIRNDNFEVFREPLGVESIAASFRKNGYEVKLFFCDLEELSDEEIVKYTDENDIKFIGISVLFDRHLEHALVLGKKIKRDSNYVIFGGPFVSFAAFEVLTYCSEWLDGIVVGEGESADVKIANAIYEGKDIHDIDGLYYINKNGEFVRNPHEKKTELDLLDRPDRDFIRRAIELGYKPHMASIYTSRGCAQRCTFCTGTAFQYFSEGKLWRYRTAPVVVDEIEKLIEEFNIRYFYICDDNFYGYGDAGEQRVLDILRLIKERNIKAKFHFEMRVDRMSEEIMLKFKEAGFVDVLLGIEAGVQSMLDRWKKGITVQQNLDAINMVRKCGLNLKPGFILFDGDTSLEELHENVNFIRNTRLYEGNSILDLFNPMQIFNGSEMKKVKIGPNVKVYTSLSEKAFTRSITHYKYDIIDSRVELFWNVMKVKIDDINRLFGGDFIAEIYANWNGEDRKKALFLVKNYRKLQKELPELVLDLCDFTFELIENGKTDNIDKLLDEKYKSLFAKFAYDHLKQYIEPC